MTIYSKLTENKQSSAKNNSNMMNSLINMPAQFEQIKNGQTGGERIAAIYNLIRGGVNLAKGNK